MPRNAALCAIALTLASVAAGCGTKRDPNAKPAGTSADPVLVCERLADVCKLDGARLGVCTQGKDGTTLVCASQH